MSWRLPEPSPDTLFYFDQECQLVFVHPSPTPEQVVNYTSGGPIVPGRPYPKETVLPSLHDWKTVRSGDERTYFFRIISWYPMPYGIAQWGDFRGWEVVDTSGTSARIIDDRALLVRMSVRQRPLNGPHEIHEAASKGEEFTVRLRRQR